ncbi:hypothetical protein KKB83_05155 [Patescibacteria group bacterium]|nr:hypothetical protein [Patescibacteria group bacterium]
MQIMATISQPFASKIGVELGEFVVMPNHIHGIVIINNPPVRSQWNNVNNVETQNLASLRKRKQQPGNQFGPQSRNLGSIVRGFKIGVKKWTTINNVDFAWQPRYYDHIIRNEKSLNHIRQYITENPAKWAEDRNNPENL